MCRSLLTLDTYSFPVSALCGLASITTISSVIPALADYLARHPSASSFFEDVVPIVLVAGLTIAVCPLLLLVANKAETLICGYQVHNSVLWRNWVFLEINVVIFFSVGRTVILSYISTRISASSVLNTVASSFPSAAPYYASYLLLQTVLQSFFELFRLGVSSRAMPSNVERELIHISYSCRSSSTYFQHVEPSHLEKELSDLRTRRYLGSSQFQIRYSPSALSICSRYTTRWSCHLRLSTTHSLSVSDQLE